MSQRTKMEQEDRGTSDVEKGTFSFYYDLLRVAPGLEEYPKQLSEHVSRTICHGYGRAERYGPCQISSQRGHSPL